MSDRRPSFQFYPGDWLSSPDVSVFSAAERGAYIQLLCFAWQAPDCGLPDDDKELAQLSKLGEDWAGESGKRVRSKFRAEGGRLYNERLLEERHKQDEHRAKQSESGRRGAEKRWGKKGPDSQPKSGQHHGTGNGDPNGVAIDRVAIGPPSFQDGKPIISPMAKNSSSSSSSSKHKTNHSSDEPETWDIAPDLCATAGRRGGFGR